ncbi:MAG: hypothetical protein DRJ20_02240 [Candidatus Methanomethylicota archaeon]|uniref:UDP-N-acetylglucosamine--dolichyl-phosphate N-acetylglucosaminephosphotransferase n=1 Tax=Thermoproteota archaeon TaxID=2056631 RepID=A0A497EWI2_9CREN|nr:MAG: hypothetical protein DRJ20_02240 [Candidatus Verstraetearchaeota archaeon]
MPPLMKFLKNKGIIGIDVHKPDKPEVPEMGGIGIVLGLFVGVLALIHVGDYAKYLAFLTTVAVTALIGLVDDLYTLRAKVKTGLTVLAFTPLVLFALLFPSQIVLGRPELPFIGRLRLTIVYWLLLPFAIAVPANAVNMMDTYNGVMSGSCAMASLSLMISCIILGRFEAAVMSAALLGALLAFYWYNRYPARVFAGDVGSLSVGAAIGAIAVIGRVEVVCIAVLMPFIMNAFHSLTSLGGLLERREIKVRPVVVGESGVLRANFDRGAPATLANLLLRKGPATELEIIHSYHVLAAVSSILGVVTALLMGVRI